MQMKASIHWLCIWSCPAMQNLTSKRSSILSKMKKRNYAATKLSKISLKMLYFSLAFANSNNIQQMVVRTNYKISWLFIFVVSLCMAWRLVLWSWKQTNVQDSQSSRTGTSREHWLNSRRVKIFYTGNGLNFHFIFWIPVKKRTLNLTRLLFRISLFILSHTNISQDNKIWWLWW